MTRNTVSIQVPEEIYQRLERLASLTKRPLETLVAQTLSAGLPPLPDDLPPTMRDALQALEQVEARVLEQVVRERMPEPEVQQFEALRERQRAGSLTPLESQALATLKHDADLRTLRKAYAAVLLKLRGQPVPSLTDLEA
ncbi:MAG: hypothetical protein EOM24_02535 [Chloroflexia bacterium]|nr:hypothetical protein [Chloroflexia bacterium]